MVANYYNQFLKFKSFLGKEVWLLFLTSVVLGLVWFAVESSFIFVLQGFLRAVGLLDDKSTFLPAYYPTSLSGSILCLLLFGLLRSALIMLKQYYSGVTNQTFVRTQREKILEYALAESSDVSSHVVINLFNDRVANAASVIQLLSMLINTAVAAVLFTLLGLKLAPFELIFGMIVLLSLFFMLRSLNKKIIVFGQKLSHESARLSEILVLGLRNHFLLKIYDISRPETMNRGKIERNCDENRNANN